MGSPVTAVVISLDGDLLDLLDDIPDLQVVGFLDANPNAEDCVLANLGTDEQWPVLKAERPHLKAVLAVDPPALRARLAGLYGEDSLLTIIAPDARVSPLVEIGPGSIVQRNVLISRNVRLGRACKVNHGAALHHDVSVGDYSTVAPAAVLLGNVVVGCGCYVGSGAIILPGRKIADGAVVGAGAVVTHDVAAATVVAGMPARPVGEVK